MCVKGGLERGREREREKRKKANEADMLREHRYHFIVKENKAGNALCRRSGCCATPD